MLKPPLPVKVHVNARMDGVPFSLGSTNHLKEMKEKVLIVVRVRLEFYDASFVHQNRAERENVWIQQTDTAATFPTLPAVGGWRQSSVNTVCHVSV